jgi:predicted lysophospholipase L1 biosynthesis ABC-type transport system permease subunit
LLPPSVHSTFDEGLLLDAQTFDRTTGVSSRKEVDPEADITRFVAVRFREGVSPEAGKAALERALAERGASVESADTPEELSNLRFVRRLPVMLAMFLSALAVSALAYVLFVTTRARERDFAVLRALGFTRRQSRRVLTAQGSLIGVIGLLAGIPIGVAIGRFAWSWIAEQVPLQESSPLALIATIVLIPVALVLANVVAVIPARRAARVRPAEILHTE